MDEKIVGLRNSFNFKHFFIGNTSYLQQFNKITNPQNNLYDKFEFREKELKSASFDYQYSQQKFTFFGEQAFQDKGVKAGIHGVLLSLSNSTETSIIYRNFDESYFAPYANPFRESSDPTNEKGIYWGIKNQLLPFITIRLYVDISESPWLKYLKNGPTDTKETFVQFEYTPNEKYTSYFRFKNESTQSNYTIDSVELKLLNNTFSKTYRIHQQFIISKKITLRNRLEYKTYTDDFNIKYSGYLLYQDFIYKKNSRWGITTRVAFAFIEDYKVRIYTNESALPYSQTNSVFTRNTLQWYLIFQYKIAKNMKVWFKINLLNGDYKEESNTQILEKNYYSLTLKYDLI